MKTRLDTAIELAQASWFGRHDWDDDQPRDEAGRFSSGGGGGGKSESGNKSSGPATGTFKGQMYKTSTEFSRKALPGGKTKREHTGEYDETGSYVPYPDSDKDEKAFMKEGERRRAAGSEWDAEVEKQISLGHLDPKVAEEAGWMRDGHAERGFTTLPKELWHVTTAADLVKKEGLKSRRELAQANGKGLGGGPDGTISFTDDPKVAEAIQNSMLEFHDLLNDKITAKDLFERAKTGSDAKKPYDADLLRSLDRVHGMSGIEPVTSKVTRVSKTNIMGESPPTNETWYDPQATRYSGLDGTPLTHIKGDWVPTPPEVWRKVGSETSKGASQPHTTHWERDKTPFEVDSKKAEFYKAYSLWREQAGGQLDPLFFSTDVQGYKNIPRDQIQTLKFQPRYSYDNEGNQVAPKGYQAGSLKEWRTYTGRATKLAEDDE